VTACDKLLWPGASGPLCSLSFLERRDLANFEKSCLRTNLGRKDSGDSKDSGYASSSSSYHVTATILHTDFDAPDETSETDEDESGKANGGDVKNDSGPSEAVSPTGADSGL